MRKLILATLLLGTVISVNAQSGTNSPYSQYGLGVLSDQTSGFNRGMNGVGLGFHEHNQINYLNPASYSAIDSLSFILMQVSQVRLPISKRMESRRMLIMLTLNM